MSLQTRLSALITAVGADIKSLNTQIAAVPTHETGIFSARPANGGRVNGSTYFATDDNGGTLYEMSAGAWLKVTPGVGPTVGRGLLDVKKLSSKVVFANGGNDVAGLSITFTYQGRNVVPTLVIPQFFVDTADSRGGFYVVDSATGGLVSGVRYYTLASNTVAASTTSPAPGAATPDMMQIMLIGDPTQQTANASSVRVNMVSGTSYTWKIQSSITVGTGAAMLTSYQPAYFRLDEL